MMEYQVIIEDHPSTLAKAVNAAMADGWQVAGGVFVNDAQFIQAMIRSKRIVIDRRLAHPVDDRQARPI